MSQSLSLTLSNSCQKQNCKKGGPDFRYVRGKIVLNLHIQYKILYFLTFRHLCMNPFTFAYFIFAFPCPRLSLLTSLLLKVIRQSIPSVWLSFELTWRKGEVCLKRPLLTFITLLQFQKLAFQKSGILCAQFHSIAEIVYEAAWTHSVLIWRILLLTEPVLQYVLFPMGAHR